MLRDYQQDILNNAIAAFNEGATAPLVVAPTGAGKTMMFCEMAGGAYKKGNRTYILVHRNFLVKQTSNKLAKMGIPHGVIASGHPVNNELIQVCSVGTLLRRLHFLPEPNFIVVDEAHHTVAGQWAQIIEAYPKALTLGVTATPERLDGTGLGIIFDRLIVGPSVKDLISAGWLVPSIVYAPPVGYDFETIRRAKSEGELEQLLDKKSITGCAIDHYRRIRPGVPAVAFCTTVAHAEHVAQQFNEAGIASAAISGAMPEKDRAKLLRDLGTGKLKVLTSCELISEGFDLQSQGDDLESVGCVILLRRTDSLSLYLQQVGRALRPDQERGKQFAFILDHVGNCFVHGLPDDDRQWSLEGSKRKKRRAITPSVKQCPKCYAAFAPAARCPVCKHVIPVQERQSELIQQDGELKPVDKASKERVNIRAKTYACRTLDELRALGKSLNYKPGWADRIWQARQTKQQNRRGIA